MFKVGDSVVLRFDDEPRNQVIVGKRLVIRASINEGMSPHWLVVQDELGNEYSVRGNDCRTATKDDK